MLLAGAPLDRLRAVSRLLVLAAVALVAALAVVAGPATAHAAATTRAPLQAQALADDPADADDPAEPDTDTDAEPAEPAEPDDAAVVLDDVVGGVDGGAGSLDLQADPLDWIDPERALEQLPRVTSAFVSGKLARLRIDGKAAIPRGAPKLVRRLISQVNRIVGRRYKWGGGHAKLVDKGYDCSGAVSFGLIATGLLRSPLVSGRFARWGAAGAGRWVTIYANRGHVYMEVAGLRLDTSAIGDDPLRKGVRWHPAIGQRRGFKVRHPLGL